MAEDQGSSDDIFNIMLATDVHLGYNECDPVRGNDSFIAFEEVLTLAKEHDVDLILLGGDLFHDSKPSPNSLLKCTTLLRKYCFGDKPVAFEILSDQKSNFPESITQTVNYEDPNMNISYPVFSIHGNHDDPVGHNSVSSLDILSKMGVVNYFGKWMDYSHVRISPVLMRKGATNLALYGLSFLKDQRLARLFKECKVEMEKVDDESEWFNILTLHQNRADRGHYNYIPEEVLPDFLDLIVWGHEHDCRIKEEWNAIKNFYVTQPGSTVATSLAHGESLPKHCALLQVYKKQFKLLPLKLETVRPFIFKTIVLSEEFLEPPSVNEHEKVQELLKKKIYDLIDEAKTMRSGHPNQPELPLIRLSVFFEHEGQDFNRNRFSQQFSELVANPGDILMMKREKKLKDRKADPTKIDTEALETVVRDQVNDEINVETMLEKYYKDQPEDRQLSVLSVTAVGEAVKDFTLKGNDEAFKRVLEKHKEIYMKFLMASNAETEFEVAEQIALCKKSMESKDPKEFKTIMESPIEEKKNISLIVDMSSDDDDDDDESLLATRNKKSPEVASPTPRGRGRGRGSRGGRGARGGNTSQAAKPAKVKPEPRTSRAKPSQPSATDWLSSMMSSRSRGQTQRSKSPPVVIDDSD